MDQQDPAYRMPGVALDRGTRDYLLSINTTDSCSWAEVPTPMGSQYAYTIQGSNFSTKEIGANGELLHGNITSCNGSTPSGCNWDFTWSSNDKEWDWRATGCFNKNGDVSCIGDAVMNVGGNTEDGCAGIE